MAQRDVDLLIHDLRGVLTTIESWASLANVQTARGLLPTEAIAGLLGACETAGAVIEGYTEGSSGSPTELTAFLSGIERSLSQEFKQRGVLLQVQPPNDPLWVSASVGDLSIILLNLLRNALEACDRGTRTLLSLRSSDNSLVQMWVEDSGDGLDESALESIFSPGVSARGTGRGLGLHAARLAAKRSGGGLHAERSSLGGAAFVLSVPLTAAPVDVTPQEISAPNEAHRTGRVLIVEDDIATRRFVQAALEHEGHEVLQAGSLKQARALLSQAELVIVDDRLPDGSGPELANETTAPLIIVSGNPALSDETGPPVLRKPFNIQDLCLFVRRRLAGK